VESKVSNIACALEDYHKGSDTLGFSWQSSIYDYSRSLVGLESYTESVPSRSVVVSSW